MTRSKEQRKFLEYDSEKERLKSIDIDNNNDENNIDGDTNDNGVNY